MCMYYGVCFLILGTYLGQFQGVPSSGASPALGRRYLVLLIYLAIALFHVVRFTALELCRDFFDPFTFLRWWRGLLQVSVPPTDMIDSKYVVGFKCGDYGTVIGVSS